MAPVHVQRVTSYNNYPQQLSTTIKPVLTKLIITAGSTIVSAVDRPFSNWFCETLPKLLRAHPKAASRANAQGPMLRGHKVHSKRSWLLKLLVDLRLRIQE